MQVYVARQPILDRSRKTYGYELLFRDGIANSFPDLDGDTATFRLLSNTFFSMGIEDILGSRPVFINFPQALIDRQIPLFFPRDKVVVEILEDVRPDRITIQAVEKLKKKGYTIALDDFVLAESLYPLIRQADIIKFDFRQSSLDEIRTMITRLNKDFKLSYLAEKIETYDEFEKALDLGCTYFQGYFFEKPRVLSNHSIPSIKNNLIRLMAQVSKADMDFPGVTRAIRDDVSMSFKLMKFINSAYYRRRYPLESVRDAIAMLGQKDITQFVMLIAATGLAEGKPEEIIKTSIITGCMCEAVGQQAGSDFTKEELFTLGLFSRIDAMLEMPMQAIVKELPFSSRINLALEGKNNHFKELNQVVTHFIRGEWQELADCCSLFKLDQEVLHQSYYKAVQTADEFLKPV
ncbi:MAG: HDOD domain-containing protein [Pseudomonadota bacterium]